MVAQFLGLKLTLLRNALTRSPVQLAGILFALLWAIVLTLIVAGTIVGLRGTTPEIARAVVIVFGSAVVLGFLLIPLVFGADDPLDPRRFTLLGLDPSKLTIGLTVAAGVSVAAVFITVLSIAQIVTWTRDAVSVLLAVLAAVIIIPTCVLASRVSTALSALYISTRRAREVAGVALVVVLSGIAPLVALFASMDWESRGLPIVRRIAAVVTWTPLGAAWSIPGDAANGRPEVWAKILIALTFLAALAAAWRFLVGYMVVRPERAPSRAVYRGLGWFDVLPASPTGAIAARSLSYWSRDARYRVALAVIPVVPIVMVIVLMIAGVPSEIIAWIPVPVMCLFLGWSAHNDIAHDSTAFWAHVSAHTPGRDDRWGRAIPALVLGIPLAVVGSIISVAVTSNWAALPGFIGLSLGVLFAGVGISSVVSAAAPYPAVLPGNSPFAQPQAMGTTGALAQSISFSAILVSVIPTVIAIVVAHSSGAGWYWLALIIGVILGFVLLYGGIKVGGRIVARHSPELLAFTMRN